MKPDKIVCLYCGTQINKGKYCSDAHRMAYKRQPEQIDNPNTNKPEQKVPEQSNPNMTTTDKTFYDRAMRDFGEPYYNFDSELRENDCAQCKKKYKTRLALNKYCSYEHYKEAITPKGTK